MLGFLRKYRRRRLDKTVQFRPECLEDRRLLAAGFEFRTIDGTGNHSSDLGAADTALIRVAPADYGGDGSGATIIGPPARENPRVISNTVVDQAGASIVNDLQFSDFVWQWGQFLDHDIDLTESDAANGTADIPVPEGDILGPDPIPFNRSHFDPSTGTAGDPRQQINEITAFIDASNVYGSDDDTAELLRTLVDGKLATSAGGELLPVVGGEFLAGDVRANEQVCLTSMHTLFVREHNRLADALGEIEEIDDIADNSGLSRDELIYQVARKIVGAEMQVITYTEFLPTLLGPFAPAGEDASYSELVDPTIANEFSTAAYRFGHSMLSPQLLLVGQDSLAESLELKDAFFSPQLLGGDDLNEPVDTGNVERLLRGLAFQEAQQIDSTIVDDVRNFLFGPPGAGGLDLGSLNIQRGRDHGIPDYNSLRKAYGLDVKSSFLDPGDGSGITRDPEVAANLAAAYHFNIDNIDAWVGGLAEYRLPGSSMGQLMTTALVEQFTRLRDGDRFFYLNDADISHEMISEVIDLDRVTLSQIIQWNTDITEIQDNVFLATGAVVEGQTLRIHGTPGTDRVVVRDLGQDQLLVSAGFLPGGAQTFDGSDIQEIEIRVFDGRDVVVNAHHLPATMDGGRGPDKLVGGRGGDYLSGGAGNDVLLGRRGSDILQGGPGSDLLLGGSGRDVLVGGLGRDALFGNSGQDILLGDRTAFDDNAEALDAIRSEWNSHRNYATRVRNIRGTNSGPNFEARFNGDYFLIAGTTVENDRVADLLVGGFGQDWFFFPSGRRRGTRLGWQRRR